MTLVVKYYDIPFETTWIEVQLVFNRDTSHWALIIENEMRFETPQNHFEEVFYFRHLAEDIPILMKKAPNDFKLEITVNGTSLDSVLADSKQEYDFWKMPNEDKPRFFYHVRGQSISWRGIEHQVPPPTSTCSFRIGELDFEFKVTKVNEHRMETELKMNEEIYPHFKPRKGEVSVERDF